MIRSVAREDLPALKGIVAATGLFPPDLLDGMLAEHAAEASTGDGGGFWLTDDEAGPIAVAYCAPERMTIGTWNLLLIAAHPAHQRRGRGAALVGRVETILIARGGRVLLVETSGQPAFEGPRAFYRRLGYAEEARIRDFYAAGEDKVVFRKALA